MGTARWLGARRFFRQSHGILTTKHTGGYCLWDSATTDHDISMFKNYKDGKGDIVREFVAAFRARDLKVGLYYCFPLWGDVWADYMTLPAENYADGTVDALAMIKTHFTELLTNNRRLLHEETVAMLKKIGAMWDPAEASQADSELYDIQREALSNVPTTEKQVAIIFPADWKAADLEAAADLLKTGGTKGTFFVNEATAKAQKEALRKLVAAGHELGNGSHDDTPVTGLQDGRKVLEQFNNIRKNVHTIQTPKFYRAPGDAYDALVWPVLTYEGLIPVTPAADLAPGAIIEVENLLHLEKQLQALKKKKLESVTLRQLVGSSTSARLRAALANTNTGAAVVTGRQ